MSDSSERKKKQKKKPSDVHANSYPHRSTTGEGGGRGRMEPLPGVFDIFLIKASFDHLNKMRYILWVVALPEACDVTNNGHHLGFY